MKKHKNLSFIAVGAIIAIVLALPFFAFGGSLSNFSARVFASEYNNKSYENISLSNQNFDNKRNYVRLDKEPSGWEKLPSTTASTSGVIYVGNEENDDKYSRNCSKYCLKENENPNKASKDFDNNVLMINSRNDKDIEIATNQGYKSNSISLKPYSFYRISLFAYTNNTAKASIYVNGLDEFENKIEDFNKTKITQINTKGVWEEYFIFIQTGFNSADISLSLYLGSDKNTSIGVVFFDNILIHKTSNEKYLDDKDKAIQSHLTEIIFKKNDKTPPNKNFDFEKGNTTNFGLLGNFDNDNVTAQVLNLKNPLQSTNMEYLGLDKTAKNTYALVISSKEKTFIGYESSAISIDQYSLYKITLNVKAKNLDGNAFVSLVEQNDVNLFYGEDFDEYKPITKNISISSTPENALMNDYQSVSFYVQGHPLYNTNVKLQLCLGSKEEKASGTVAFDNIKIYELTYSEFESVSTSSNEEKVTFSSITEKPTISNANFNTAYVQDVDQKYPLQPSDWVSDNAKDNLFGILNTNETNWENNGLNLATIKNPSIVIGETTITTPTSDTNNILAIINKEKSHQTITSPNFTLESNSTYTLSFNFLAINEKTDGSHILNIQLIDKNNKIVFEDLNVKSSSWELYEIAIKTQWNSVELHFVFEVGTKKQPAQGSVFFDNFDLSKQADNFDFEALASNPQKHLIDFSNIGLKVKGNEENSTGLFEALLFEPKVENSDSQNIAVGGIDKNGNLMIIMNGVGIYSLTSVYSLKLDAKSYYKFAVKIKTDFDNKEIDDAHSYGAKFNIVGLTNACITQIKSTSSETYEIFIYAEDEKEVNVSFALESDSRETSGTAIFESFCFENSSRKDYQNAEKWDTESDRTLVFATTEIPEEETEEETKEPARTPNIFILLSTIVMVLAFVIAITGWALRKVKAKKIKIKKENSYNRSTTIAKSIIIQQAEKQKNAEIKALKEELAEMEKYLADFEEKNKAIMQSTRHEKITRKTESHFKVYSSTRSRIVRDIEKIKERIKEAESPEYLMKLESKLSNHK